MIQTSAAISVENLWKSFTYLSRGSETLKETFLSWLRRGSSGSKSRELYNGLSFSIQSGEVVAFLGKNGSGKSTLLKLISGIYWPDRGEIRVNGKLSALIELGAGFHPEFSGRENVFIYGQVLGMPRKKMAEIVQDIIEFSELGDFIDQPVKVYSSGMYMRLAFSVAVMIDPDILVIDEILSVGDFSFARKCMAKMNEFKAMGKTICLVSHDLQTVQSWATRAIVLHLGRVVFDGPPEEAVRFYLGLEKAAPVSSVGIAVPQLETPSLFSRDLLGLWQDRFLTSFMKPIDFDLDVVGREKAWVIVASSANDLLPFGYSHLKLSDLLAKFEESFHQGEIFQIRICILKDGEGLSQLKNLLNGFCTHHRLKSADLQFHTFEHLGSASVLLPAQCVFYSLDWVSTSQVFSTIEYRFTSSSSVKIEHIALWGEHDFLELPRGEQSFRLQCDSCRVPLSFKRTSCSIPMTIKQVVDSSPLDSSQTFFKVVVLSDFALSSSSLALVLRSLQDFCSRLSASDREALEFLFWGDPIAEAALSPENSSSCVAWGDSLIFSANKTVFVTLNQHDIFLKVEEALRNRGITLIGGSRLDKCLSEEQMAVELEQSFRDAFSSQGNEVMFEAKFVSAFNDRRNG